MYTCRFSLFTINQFRYQDINEDRWKLIHELLEIHRQQFQNVYESQCKILEQGYLIKQDDLLTEETIKPQQIINNPHTFDHSQNDSSVNQQQQVEIVKSSKKNRSQSQNIHFNSQNIISKNEYKQLKLQDAKQNQNIFNHQNEDSYKKSDQIFFNQMDDIMKLDKSNFKRQLKFDEKLIRHLTSRNIQIIKNFKNYFEQFNKFFETQQLNFENLLEQNLIKYPQFCEFQKKTQYEIKVDKKQQIRKNIQQSPKRQVIQQQQNLQNYLRINKEKSQIQKQQNNFDYLNKCEQNIQTYSLGLNVNQEISSIQQFKQKNPSIDFSINHNIDHPKSLSKPSKHQRSVSLPQIEQKQNLGQKFNTNVQQIRNVVLNDLKCLIENDNIKDIQINTKDIQINQKDIQINSKDIHTKDIQITNQNNQTSQMDSNLNILKHYFFKKNLDYNFPSISNNVKTNFRRDFNQFNDNLFFQSPQNLKKFKLEDQLSRIDYKINQFKINQNDNPLRKLNSLQL